MKLYLPLLKDFGTHLGDGALASEYRLKRIDPYAATAEEIVLDFSGVRTANSSFINALVAGVLEQHGETVLNVLTFKGCNSVIQVLVEAAIDLGLEKFEERVAA